MLITVLLCFSAALHHISAYPKIILNHTMFHGATLTLQIWKKTPWVPIVFGKNKKVFCYAEVGPSLSLQSLGLTETKLSGQQLEIVSIEQQARDTSPNRSMPRARLSPDSSDSPNTFSSLWVEEERNVASVPSCSALVHACPVAQMSARKPNISHNPSCPSSYPIQS